MIAYREDMRVPQYSRTFNSFRTEYPELYTDDRCGNPWNQLLAAMRRSSAVP